MWLLDVLLAVWLLYFFGKIIYGFLKGFLIGLQFRYMRWRGQDPLMHPVFADPIWGHHFENVRLQLEAEKMQKRLNGLQTVSDYERLLAEINGERYVESNDPKKKDIINGENMASNGITVIDV